MLTERDIPSYFALKERWQTAKMRNVIQYEQKKRCDELVVPHWRASFYDRKT